MRKADVIVVGGGHAGCEAAAAAARSGASTVLVTASASTVGVMSCNPAIGGVGKGHLVRELDVFDGLMARAADAAAIHHRMLNRSKGAAVRGPRIQADRRRYQAAIQAMLAQQPNLSIIEAQVEALDIARGVVAGVRLSAGVIKARAVVLTTGTFLGGRLHFGLESSPGGRIGDAAADTLARQIRDLGLPIGRLKTGTPPRLDGRTIDWAKVTRQPSDEEHWRMSMRKSNCRLPQIACGLTRTTQHTHELIRAGLDRSPLYAGQIEGVGPRYCPSIEDKIVRFGDRDGHQLFLEPEGLDDPLVYPNGISTSLPLDLQQAMIASIPGLEHAEIRQQGYAVEYDYLDPRALDCRLHLETLPGLFCAGQINGTTGYEEAAAQGLIAGLNAAALACETTPVQVARDEAYIGVMIDDLTLQGVTEPYRMLTSRAEYRLALRADNAASRLGRRALESDAVSERHEAMLVDHLNNRDHAAASHARGGDLSMFDPALAEEIIEDARYAPYLERQRVEIERIRRDGEISLPSTFNYRAIRGLSNEMVERLANARPLSLAEAGRVRGVTPAALTAILMARRRPAA